MSPNDREEETKRRSPIDTLLIPVELADGAAELATTDLDALRSALSDVPSGDVDVAAVRSILETAAEDGCDVASVGAEAAVDGASVAGEGAVALAEVLVDVAGTAEAALDLLELLEF